MIGKVLKIAAVVCISFCVFFTMAYCQKKQKAEQQAGMFCWDEEAVGEPETIEELTRKLHITRWYQEFPEKLSIEATSEFVRHMSMEGVTVDALVGSVEWGFEPDGASLIQSISAINEYNKSVAQDRRIRGIMADIEPYVTETFKSNKEKYMRIYVQGMKAAYAYAKENKIRFIACIPRHYEEQGLSEELEELIGKACDEVAVMNYGRGNEVEMIATEAELAKKYDKGLHCILEFQDVGKHGLTAQETYRQEGIKEALKTWEKVRAAYPDAIIIADYHWTRPLLKMLEEE